MPTHTISFDLDEPPERVFDYIADIRNESKWQKDLKRAEKTSDGPVVFLGEGPRVWMRFVMDVAPSPSGSRVTFFIDMRPQGAFKLFTPLLSLGLPKEMAKRPEQFRAALTAG